MLKKHRIEYEERYLWEWGSAVLRDSNWFILASPNTELKCWAIVARPSGTKAGCRWVTKLLREARWLLHDAGMTAGPYR